MKKRLLSIMMALTMCLSITACGTKTKSEPVSDNKNESDEDSYSYNISALLSKDNRMDEILLQGFSDALTDYIGEDHFTITTAYSTEETPSETIAANAVKSSADMIFTTGKSTLQAAADATDTIPIVATDIIDFKGTLRIASLGGKSWDKTTGRNITGVSSKPSIVDQVSLMIESTKDLQTVGILFSPEDTDAIYQNEIFEAYLDQAGIPWKEYLIPASNTTAKSAGEEKNSTALSPSKYVAFSAKEGMDNEVVSLGDNPLFGLNSPSSTRVALISDFWTGPKVIAKQSEDEAEASNDEKSDEDTKNSDSDIEVTLEDRIKEACNECSAIYVPFESMLTDQMDVIGDIAKSEDVVTVAGDTSIGQNSLVTLFMDPYSLGYAAGKKAVRVFNGDDITTIKIGYGDTDECVKLYNGEIAEKFDMEFPKSFNEFNDFLSTYTYGSNTIRYSFSGE
ncbi:MAG: hypothetical protein K5883_06260 [Pseudobutyrivibrio sp.]|nr:hypothetical protein [Pseudobutyrivibrio sp.]